VGVNVGVGVGVIGMVAEAGGCTRVPQVITSEFYKEAIAKEVAVIDDK
jgi:hypothetical protein